MKTHGISTVNIGGRVVRSNWHIFWQ